MEANEIFVEIKPEALILIHVNIDVIMIRIIFISVVTDSLHKKLVDQV